MPWDKPEVYDRWSPSKFSNEFKTPTLVIHGEMDFRVPVNQGCNYIPRCSCTRCRPSCWFIRMRGTGC